MKRNPAWLVLWIVPVTGCAPALHHPVSEAECRRLEHFVGAGMGAVEKEELRWSTPADRAVLDAWCSRVGGALHIQPIAAEATIVDRLPVVVWNTHVGAADVDRLIAELRAGQLSSETPAHFVLLLQEAFRALEPADSVTLRASIDRIALRHGLHLLYVPARASRGPSGAPVRGDRGNAILSTLPLQRPHAIELPVQKERRLAVAASVGAVTSAGQPWSIRLVNVHLDHIDWKRPHGSLGDGRARHAQRLLDLIADEPHVVLGGDFNTWFGEADEPAIRLVRESFRQPHALPARNTLLVLPLPVRQLDFMFFRFTEPWWGRYDVLADAYGSDHRPLLGSVSFDAPRN